MTEGAEAVAVEQPVEDPYAGVREDLKKKEQPWHVGWKALLFLVSLGLFVAAMPDRSPLVIGLVLAALVLHEGGHFVAMKLFGYEDVSVFFMPFIGAAVSGRAKDPGGWRAGIVSLAGPVPGLVLGAGLLALAPAQPLLRAAGAVLVVLNGINLLPFEPLDGGRVLSIVLFSRHRVLEMLGIVAGLIGLVVLDLLPGNSAMWAGALGGLMYNRLRVIDLAHGLRRSGVYLGGKTSELPPETMAPLQAAAWKVSGAAKSPAAMMRVIHEAAATKPAGWAASALLFAVWAAASGGAWVLQRELKHPTPHWAPLVEAEGRWQAELPGPMDVNTEKAQPYEGIARLRHRSSNSALGEFTVLDLELEATDSLDNEDAWARMHAMVESTRQQAKLGPASEKEVAYEGRAALEVNFPRGNLPAMQAVYVNSGNTFVVLVTTSTDAAVSARFLKSLHFLR